MLTLRDEQLRRFQQEGDRGFVQRAVEHLRAEYPEQTEPLSDATLCAMVHSGLQRARGHGLALESSLIRFLELMLAVAPNFDEQPEISLRLRDPALSEPERIYAVIRDTKFAEWKQAIRDYNPDSWNLDLNQYPALIELRGAIQE